MAAAAQAAAVLVMRSGSGSSRTDLVDQVSFPPAVPRLVCHGASSTGAGGWLDRHGSSVSGCPSLPVDGSRPKLQPFPDGAGAAPVSSRPPGHSSLRPL